MGDKQQGLASDGRSCTSGPEAGLLTRVEHNRNVHTRRDAPTSVRGPLVVPRARPGMGRVTTLDPSEIWASQFLRSRQSLPLRLLISEYRIGAPSFEGGQRTHRCTIIAGFRVLPNSRPRQRSEVVQVDRCMHVYTEM